MSMVILGTVRDGVVVPSQPLPEGSCVEIRMHDPADLPPELREELAAWQQASAESLMLVERLADEE